MLRRLAVVGDQLDTGGQIESYSGPSFFWHGHQVALIGGSAYCTTCKSAGQIAKTGGPRRIEFMGEAAADGDIVLCKCSRPPRIVAKLAGESWCDDEAEAHTARDVKQAIKAANSGMNAARRYDEGYTLTDRNGRALANVRYRVRSNSATVANGVTDSSGHTQRVSATTAQWLTLEVYTREGES
ncbi:PAAR domain-containing protein [Paraburkholderia sacchari]|uniref:PAAR domain-containing protein n=1 Tax=Paraburkholderia sacchari TaxID=159450 RepID=UPI0039A4B863